MNNVQSSAGKSASNNVSIPRGLHASTQPGPFDHVVVRPGMSAPKRPASAAPKPRASKKARTVVIVRQQQLPAETLLYVLDCLDRNTLDQCVLVSSSHEKLVGRASPLRRVKTALLHRCAFKARQGYRALFSCHEVVREQQKCVRQQQLPTETLLYVLNCLDRNALDQCPLVSRRHAALTDRANPLRRVKTAMLHRWSRARQGYRAFFSCHKVVRKQSMSISFIVENQEQAINHFLNALRFCYVEETITLADVVIDRTFVERVDAMASDYWFDGDKLDTKNLELRVSLVELQTSFRFRGMKCVDLSTMRHLSQRMELGDAFLGSLAQSGVWNVNFGYRRNTVSDDAILKFAFGDYPEGADDRELTIWKVSASPKSSLMPTSEPLEAASKFIDQLVKAHRESGGSHTLRMTLVCEDFSHSELFANAQTDRRGTARLVFDDVPNFGMVVLPMRYIAGVHVRELCLWSNVPEPNVGFDEEEDSVSEVDSGSDEYSDSEEDYGYF